jgi:hypothetical protein
VYAAEHGLFTDRRTNQQAYFQSPFTKGVFAIAASAYKTHNKIKGTYLVDFAQRKTAGLSDSVNNRFVKELCKFFFTLPVKKRFVDIVKCV